MFLQGLVPRALLRYAAFTYIAVVCSMFFTSPLLAASLTVTSLADGPGVCPSASNCTLYQAIATAGAGDEINFGVVGTISITAPLIISKDLKIMGPGDTILSVTGHHVVAPIFDVTAGTVAMSGLDINGGPEMGSWSSRTSGLIIRQGASLTMTACTIQRHDAWDLGGGGIRNNGSLTLVASKVLSNSVIGRNSDGQGGGIYVATSATLTLIDSTIHGNSASGDWGKGQGGGIYQGPSSIVNIRGSTIDNNIVSTPFSNLPSEGGGIYEDVSATLQIANSTISGNIGGSGFSGISTGGGVFQRESSLLTLSNTSIYGNTATTAGGLYVLGTASGKNNIIAGNSPGADMVGTLTGSNNLTSLTNLNMGPLANNGGSTKTHALLAGSAAAVGQGDVATCSNAPVNGVDQRGKPRKVASCSIGSYEPSPQVGIGPLLELLLE